MLDPNIYGRDCAMDPEPEHPRLAADNPGGGYKWISHVINISMGFDWQPGAFVSTQSSVVPVQSRAITQPVELSKTTAVE